MARRSRASRLPQLEDAIDAVLAELMDKGVTAEELERSKNRHDRRRRSTRRTTSRTLARWYGAALTTGATVEQVQTWPDRIRAVTADSLREAARRLARQAPLGHRLSDQGHALARRNARESALLLRRAAAALLAGAVSCSLLAPARRPRSSGSSVRAASKSGWCAMPPSR